MHGHVIFFSFSFFLAFFLVHIEFTLSSNLYFLLVDSYFVYIFFLYLLSLWFASFLSYYFTILFVHSSFFVSHTHINLKVWKTPSRSLLCFFFFCTLLCSYHIISSCYLFFFFLFSHSFKSMKNSHTIFAL